MPRCSECVHFLQWTSTPAPGYGERGLCDPYGGVDDSDAEDCNDFEWSDEDE